MGTQNHKLAEPSMKSFVSGDSLVTVLEAVVSLLRHPSLGHLTCRIARKNTPGDAIADLYLRSSQIRPRCIGTELMYSTDYLMAKDGRCWFYPFTAIRRYIAPAEGCYLIANKNLMLFERRYLDSDDIHRITAS
jgi:hypothetical protein